MSLHCVRVGWFVVSTDPRLSKGGELFQVATLCVVNRCWDKWERRRVYLTGDVRLSVLLSNHVPYTLWLPEWRLQAAV